MALALAPTGCESRLGDPYPGGQVTGEVIYEGTEATSFEEPVLIVTATVVLAPSGGPPPNALLSRSIRVEELGAPIPYSLDPLPPGSYYVIALIADGANFDALASPRGFLPNQCEAFDADRSVTLEQGEVVVSDIHVFDGNDPCSLPDGGL